MHDEQADEATTAWIEVVALLTAAADRAGPGADLPDVERSWAFGAQIVACDALALLPGALDGQLDALELPADTDAASIADLIAAADLAASRHPVTHQPDGAGAVRSRLAALRLEAGA